MALSQQKTSEIQQQYDPMRKRAQQQEAANLQGQNDAMARRAAAQGGGPGGAYEKQAQLAQESSAQRLQGANEGINAQQSGALNQAREVQDQRDFQTSERVGSQDFARGERMGSQDWQGSQADKQRAFSSSERRGSQEFARKERLGSQEFTFDQNAANRIQQRDQFTMQMDRDYERFMHEQDVDKFNMDMADKMYKKKDMLEQLFGNFSGSSVSGGWKSIFGDGSGGGPSVFGGEGGF